MKSHGGHSPSNFENPKILTKSTAIPEGNPEVAAALEAGIPVLTRAQIMTAITAKKKSIVVAGTHGKTTTSSICQCFYLQQLLSLLF